MQEHAFRILGLETSFDDSFDRQPDPIRPAIATSTTHHTKADRANASRGIPADAQVTVRLGDLLPLLMEATQKNRTWIRDFFDDDIKVSKDLYEVALAYRALGRAA